MSADADALAPFLADRYVVEGEVGRGGMATVFRARDLKHERPVALKVLRPELTVGLAAERFLREIRIAANLQHPHIVPLYDSGSAGPFLYFVMPLVRGESLRRRLDRDGPLTIADVLRIGREVAEAIACAHRASIVHRDIKPENILLSDGHALVSDFGIATAIHSAGRSGLTGTGVMVGTPAYMSPEQADGGRVDERADVYSLGCVLYEMLAGRPPVEGATPVSVLVGHALGKVRPLAERRPDVPPDLEKVVAKALATRADDRFAGATELRSALDLAVPVAAGGARGSPARREVASIAVLPFVDLSREGDQQYFADGIAEELIHALARVDGLRVAARSSAFAFGGAPQDVRTVGARLGVGTVLEGSVRRAGSRLRISVQLVEAETGYHVWSDRFEREISDIFAIQDEIAEAIVGTIAPKLRQTQAPLVPARQPAHRPDPEAYELFLQGRYNWYKRFEVGLQTAVHLFERSIEKDPRFAPPYAGVADAFHSLGIFGFLPPGAARARALPAVERALALDPALAAAHFSRGGGLLFFDWDLEGAEVALRKAVELEPTHAEAIAWLSFVPTLLGRPEDGVELAVRARTVDPDSPYVATLAALTHTWVGDRATAARILRWVVEQDPGLSTAHFLYGDALAATGHALDAVAWVERGAALTNRALLWLCGLGSRYARAGRASAAASVHAEIEERRVREFVPSTGLAMLAANEGRTDAALDLLAAAVEERNPTLLLSALMPIFDPLRGEPRFGDLLRHMGIDVDALERHAVRYV